jgi:uncharacterized protein YndB with AHSA1/START domain
LVSSQDADRVLEFSFSSSAASLWEWFNDPARRSQWMSAEIVPVLRVGGRLAPGARNHCVHGKHEVVVEDLLDIKPFEYFTIEQRPRGSPFSVRLTMQFVSLGGGGTRLLLTSRSYGGGVPRWLTRLVSRYFVERAILRNWSFDRLDDLIAASA